MNLSPDKRTYDELLFELERLKGESEALRQEAHSEKGESTLSVGIPDTIADIFEEALGEFIGHLIQATGMDSIAVYTLDESSNLHLKTRKSLFADYVFNDPTYTSESSLVELILNGEPFYRSHTELHDLPWLFNRDNGFHSISVTPIRHKGEALGCINAGSRVFKEIPQNVKILLEAFAAQCALMIVGFRKYGELLESHGRLKTMFGQIQDFLFIGNELGEVIEFNPAVAKKLGYTHRELMSKNFAELHPVGRRQEAIDVVNAMLRGEKSNCVIPLVTKSGDLIPVETKVSLGEWHGKQYIYGVSRDMTEIISTQEALKKSEETYRQMFQVNQAVKLLVDPETADIVDANQAAADFYGYNIEKLKTMKVFDISLMTPDEILMVMQSVAAKHIRSVNTQHVNRKKKVFDVEVFTSPLNLGDKTLLFAIVIDVSSRVAAQNKLAQTEKSLREANETLELRVSQRSKELETINSELIKEIEKHSETASSLRDSENNLRILLDSAPIGIVVIQDGRYTYVNDSFIQLLGLECRPSAVGKIVGSFGGEKLVAEFRRFLDRCLEESEPLHVRELKVKFRAGRESVFNIWLQPLDLRGKPSVIGFFIDVSEEMHLRSHLNQSQKMEALGSLAGGIAHDFNNILFAITGFAELAIDASKSNPRAGRHLDQLLGAAERAADLIRHILTFSREAESERKPMWISPVLKESLNFLRASIPAGIEIRRNIYPDGGLVNADPTQIHQVIMNLITNAAHSMRDKGGILEVDLEDVELSAESEELKPGMAPGVYQRLRVSDTGHGISQEIMNRIFDPYFTTKQVGEGTGLGLSVVDGIIRSHEGHISVKSALGKGTVFEVYLPVIVQTEEPVINELDSGALVKGRILMVDDEKIVTRATQANLQNLGYQVETENDPLSALVTFQSDPYAFDLIITDMSMPRMNGAELSLAILKIRPDMPIVMLSGFADLMDKEKATAMGLRDFLLKPLRRGVLAETVSKALSDLKTQCR